MTKERLQEIYDEWNYKWKYCVDKSPINEMKCKQLSADAYAVELLESIPEILEMINE